MAYLDVGYHLSDLRRLTDRRYFARERAYRCSHHAVRRCRGNVLAVPIATVVRDGVGLRYAYALQSWSLSGLGAPRSSS